MNTEIVYCELPDNYDGDDGFLFGNIPGNFEKIPQKRYYIGKIQKIDGIPTSYRLTTHYGETIYFADWHEMNVFVTSFIENASK